MRIPIARNDRTTGEFDILGATIVGSNEQVQQNLVVEGQLLQKLDWKFGTYFQHEDRYYENRRIHRIEPERQAPGYWDGWKLGSLMMN